MDYYCIEFPAGTKLGLSVIKRSEAEPNLGNTLVEDIPDINR